MSSEWTAGAFNTTHKLVEYYSTSSLPPEDYLKLNEASNSMLTHNFKLGTDKYTSSGFTGAVDAQFLEDVPSDEIGILYSSSRYDIPFGWYGNPIPNTASTAWEIMLLNKKYSDGFDPFSYKNISNDYTSKLQYDRDDPNIYHDPLVITVINKVRDDNREEYTRPVLVYRELGAERVGSAIIIAAGSSGEINLKGMSPDEKLLFNFIPDPLSPESDRNACTLMVFELLDKFKNQDPLHSAITVQGADVEWTKCPYIVKSKSALKKRS